MTKRNGKGLRRALVAGAATAAGLAAGYYFYASKDAKKNRKVALAWGKGLKDQVLEQAGKMKDLDRTKIFKAIDTVAGGYERAREIDVRQVRSAVQELRKNWKEIAGELGREVAKRTKPAKKSKKR